MDTNFEQVYRQLTESRLDEGVLDNVRMAIKKAYSNTIAPILFKGYDKHSKNVRNMQASDWVFDVFNPYAPDGDNSEKAQYFREIYKLGVEGIFKELSTEQGFKKSLSDAPDEKEAIAYAKSSIKSGLAKLKKKGY